MYRENSSKAKKYMTSKADLQNRKLKKDLKKVDSVRRLQFEGDYIHAIMEAKIEIVEKLGKEIYEDGEYLVKIQDRINELISVENS